MNNKYEPTQDEMELLRQIREDGLSICLMTDEFIEDVNGGNGNANGPFTVSVERIGPGKRVMLYLHRILPIDNQDSPSWGPGKDLLARNFKSINDPRHYNN